YFVEREKIASGFDSDLFEEVLLLVLLLCFEFFTEALEVLHYFLERGLRGSGLCYRRVVPPLVFLWVFFFPALHLRPRLGRPVRGVGGVVRDRALDVRSAPHHLLGLAFGRPFEPVGGVADAQASAVVGTGHSPCTLLADVLQFVREGLLVDRAAEHDVT